MLLSRLRRLLLTGSRSNSVHGKGGGQRATSVAFGGGGRRTASGGGQIELHDGLGAWRRRLLRLEEPGQRRAGLGRRAAQRPESAGVESCGGAENQ